MMFGSTGILVRYAPRLLLATALLTLVACGGGGSGGYGGSGGSSSGSSSGGSSGGGYGGGGGGGGTTSATPYSMTALVSNGVVSAVTKDSNLVNPWGIVFAPGDAVWIANNGSNTSTLYDGDGNMIPLTVAIPPGSNGPANPTGIVANSGAGFVVTSGAQSAPAAFLFAGEAGTLAGWAQSVDQTNAITAYDDGAGGAVYKGLAIAADSSGALRLYATDFRNNKIDEFDPTFTKVKAAGGFVDSSLPAGYAPFGIQALTVGGQTLLYVTYAKQQSPANQVVGAGLGLVDVFDTQGNLKTHLITAGGQLNAPWGLALAPANFGTYSGNLLVGNFGDGWINAFDASTGAFKGTIADSNATPIANKGLWAIAFGNGANHQPTTTLFFSAGLDAEADGVYGRIDLGATPPDLTPPTVSISAPAANATVSGTVTVTASVTDKSAIASVTLKAGTSTIATVTTSPYSASWNTTSVANGPVEITATATDAAGNSALSAPVTVTVDNQAQPAVTFSELQSQIFTPICSVCHTGNGTSLPGSMNLTAGHAYASIVNVASVEQPGLKRINPDNPTSSYLVLKIEGAPGISGARMPFGGPYLSQSTINEVISWVEEGAPNN
ncbi:MAG TPA: TIGR03118 family protein [Steroidobacteraceae bacterium]|nr:TIGR03118 family protein [Steroidobacteraceae bacterium]